MKRDKRFSDHEDEKAKKCGLLKERAKYYDYSLVRNDLSYHKGSVTVSGC
jgi:hypothetical protein